MILGFSNPLKPLEDILTSILEWLLEQVREVLGKVKE